MFPKPSVIFTYNNLTIAIIWTIKRRLKHYRMVSTIKCISIAVFIHRLV